MGSSGPSRQALTGEYTYPLTPDSLIPSIRNGLQHRHTLLEEPLWLPVLVGVPREHIRRISDVDLGVLPLSVQRFDLLPPGHSLSDQFHGVVCICGDVVQER